MRITSKGQVTIPQHIRHALGLLPHTEVVFEVDGDAARIRKAPDTAGSDRGSLLLGALRSSRSNGMSTDEIMALTRDEGDDT